MWSTAVENSNFTHIYQLLDAIESRNRDVLRSERGFLLPIIHNNKMSGEKFEQFCADLVNAAIRDNGDQISEIDLSGLGN